MDLDLESTFTQQFTGSAAANLAFGILFMVGVGLKKLCDRKTKCKSKCHTGCCDIDVQDVTLRQLPTEPRGQSSEV